MREPPGAAGELEVRGPELSLRYARAEDAPRTLPARLGPGGDAVFLLGAIHGSERQAADYIANLARKRAEGERLEFVIEHHEDGVIGVTGLSEFALRDRRAVVGTWHGPRVVGDGREPPVEGARARAGVRVASRSVA